MRILGTVLPGSAGAKLLPHREHRSSQSWPSQGRAAAGGGRVDPLTVTPALSLWLLCGERFAGAESGDRETSVGSLQVTGGLTVQCVTELGHPSSS